MRKFIIAAALTLGAFVVTSCGKDSKLGYNDREMGQVKLTSIATDSEFQIVAATKAEPTLADFKVKIKNPSGLAIKTWNSYTDMEAIVTIPSGEYTMEVQNGDLKAAAFDSPFYYGSSLFTVAIQELVNVDVVATLANVKVSVAYSDKFKSEVSNIEVIVNNNAGAVEGDNTGILTYTPVETRDGYFSVPSDGMLSVTVTGTRNSDQKIVTETVRIKNVTARQWHKVTIDLATAGTANPGIEINHELIEKQGQVVIPGNDDIISGNDDIWDDKPTDPDPDPEVPDPTPTVPTIVGSNLNGVAFDIDQQIDVHVGTEATPVANELDVLIAAPNGGIANLFLTINCAALSEILPMLGINGQIDLANPPTEGAWVELFSSEDIGILDPAVPIKNKMTHVFSVGKLMTMLGGVGAMDQVSDFVIEVVDDKGGRVTKTLKIKVLE